MAELQEREYLAYLVSIYLLSVLFLVHVYSITQKANDIPANLREIPGGMTPEQVEAELKAEQLKVDEGSFVHHLQLPSRRFLTKLAAAVPLTEDEQIEKEGLIAQGFENWSRRDFQQFIRALETYGWCVLQS